MLKTLILLFIILAAGLLGYWVNMNDFPINFEAGNYLIETSAGRLLILLLFFLFGFYVVVKSFWLIANFPSKISGKRKVKKHEEGLKNIMSGFSALAAGDITTAKKLAKKSDSNLPNEPLVKLLQAQIYSVKGEQAEAEQLYSELSKIEASKFIGYRGLISQSIENGELSRALELAQELLKNNPKSNWLNEAVIDLSFRENRLEDADKYVEKARRVGAINRSQAKEYSAIIYYLQAVELTKQNQPDEAKEKLEESHSANSQFLPTAILLAKTLFDLGEIKQSQKFIEKNWEKSSHPSLLYLYERSLADLTKDKQKKKLATLKKKNSDGGAGKCWFCKESGVQHSEWKLYSDSGHFNSIVWGKPPSGKVSLSEQSDKFLLVK